MIRVLVFAFLSLLLSLLLQPQGSVAGDYPRDGGQTNETAPDAGHVQSPRQYIESRLGGKIIRLERDPDSLLRAVLFVERNGSVTQHVMEVTLESKSDVREVKVVTPNGGSERFPPVVVMPRSLISPCWLQCKGKCPDTECRVKCLFDCIVN